MKEDRWFPFLGVRKLHPDIASLVELDHKQEWKAFIWSFRSQLVIFAVWIAE